MLRRFVALLMSLALTLSSAQPGVAAMVSLAVGVTGGAHAAHLDMTDPVAMDGMHMATMHRHSYPHEAGDTLRDVDCCDHSWLACAIHCGVTAPVFVLGSDSDLNSDFAGYRRTTANAHSLVSENTSPPFRPPKPFLHA